MYCQTELELVPHTNPGGTKRCKKCHVIFFITQEEEILRITWERTKIGNRYYCAKIYPGPTGNAPEFVIYYCSEGENSPTPPIWRELFRWNFIPELWFPNNFSDKIKTHIPFL
jgi:hypothetical protein